MSPTGAAEPKETARIEAFSDGVFAIAITLLVLEIKAPVTPPGRLWEALGQAWEGYLGYVISFLVILVMWINHHRLFRLIRRTDESLLFWNGILLMTVSFVPYPTSVLASNLRPATDSKGAAFFYSGYFILIAVAFNALWLCISFRGRLVDADLDRPAIADINRRYATGPLIYAAATALAWWSVPACLFANLALALFFLRPVRR